MWLILYCYCKEKFFLGHSWELTGQDKQERFSKNTIQRLEYLLTKPEDNILTRYLSTKESSSEAFLKLKPKRDVLFYHEARRDMAFLLGFVASRRED